MLIAVALLLSVLGCNKSSRPLSGWRQPSSDEQTAHADEMAKSALKTLESMEEQDSREPAQQAIDRLDHWVQLQKPLPDWKVDPMASTMFTTFAELAERLQPIHAAIEPHRYALELKGLTRQLERLPDYFAKLGQKPQYQDLDALVSEHEALAKQVELVGKQLGDPSKEEQYNERVLGEFKRKVKAPFQAGTDGGTDRRRPATRRSGEAPRVAKSPRIRRATCRAEQTG